MVRQLEIALEVLRANPPAKTCDICEQMIRLAGESGRHCMNYKRDIPDNYNGAGCKAWREPIPF